MPVEEIDDNDTEEIIDEDIANSVVDRGAKARIGVVTP